MNILIGVTQLNKPNGGVSTHVVDLCKYLIKEGNNVVVTSKGGEYVEQIEKMGIKHYEIPFDGIQKRPLEMLKAYSKLKNIIKEHKIDVIHTHGQSIIIFAQLLKVFHKTPYIWTNHIDAIPQPKLLKTMHNMFKFPIISVSTDLKEFLTKDFNIDEKYITVINNGVPLEKYEQLSKNEIIELKNKFNIEADEFVITLMGRLANVKGHQLLLNAIKELESENAIINKKIKLLFAGQISNENDKKYIEEKIEFAKNNNINLEYVGFQKPRDVFGVSNLSVLPSYKEGFAIVCAESFLMKCPVVRADTPGYSDMKNISWIFKKGDLNEFKEKLKIAINNDLEREKITQKAYLEATRKFNLDKMGEKTYKIYEKLRSK